MSRALLLTVLSLILALPLAGQDREEIARLERKADSLVRLWSEADALANLADSLARAPVVPTTDTLIVGGLQVVTNHSPLPVRAAAEQAWPVIDSLYGAAGAGLAHTPYLIQAVHPDSIGRVPRLWGLQVPWNLSPAELAELLFVYVPMPPADQAFQRWAGNTFRPSPRGWQSDLEESYVALVTSHYAIGQECFLGQVDRCRSLLGLDQDTEPLRLFPTLAERQKLARLLSVAYRETGLRADVMSCLAGSDSSCQAALIRLPPEQIPQLAPRVLRTGLTTLALRLGGREAYNRLMADSLAPMAARLADASGAPLDSLLGLWHAAVVGARPKPVAIPPFGAAVGLGWGVVLGLLALRSSRWRAL
jgi:hypothetical protein